MNILKSFVLRNDDGSAKFGATVQAFGTTFILGGHYARVGGVPVLTLVAKLPGLSKTLAVNPPDQVKQFVAAFLSDTEPEPELDPDHETEIDPPTPPNPDHSGP